MAKNESVVKDVCEAVGWGIGSNVGLVAGAVGGAYKLIASGGDWNEAGKTFARVAETCIEEGGKAGREHSGVIVSVAIGILTGGMGGGHRS